MRQICVSSRAQVSGQQPDKIFRYFSLPPEDLGQSPIFAKKRAARKGPPLRSWKRPDDLEYVHVILIADEAHLLDMRPLGHGEHLVDDFVAGGRVRLQVKLRDRIH